MIFEKHVQQISHLILSKYSDLGIKVSDVQIQETKKEFEGDFTLVVFPLLKIFKKPIEEIANEIGLLIQDQLDFVLDFNIVHGFLNLKFKDDFWLDVLEFSFTKNFEINAPKNQHILIESSSPNTNKPLHLGHLRNILLGHSIANIRVADGYKVTRVQIINDRGIHICKSMVAWLDFGNEETPITSNVKGDYLVGKYYILFEKKYKEEQSELVKKGLSIEEAKSKSNIFQKAQKMLRKWEAGDSETIKIWEMMNGWVYEGFDTTYKKIGVSFDKNYYESDTYLIGRKMVLEGAISGLFEQRKDSSIWVNFNDEDLDDKLLLRSDGTAVYMTQDLGTAIIRHNDFNFDQMIYVVGNEQNHHFNVLFKILKKMGYDWCHNLHHLSYGMVNLPDGKMKSREGKVIDIDDLLEDMYTKSKEIIMSANKSNVDNLDSLSVIVGDAALKYFILKPDAKKNILFNPEDSIDFNGHTGPFIQYTYARIYSVLQKGNNWDRVFTIKRSLLNEELNLIKLILNYPLVIHQSSFSLNPAILANYLYNLSKEYNHFYQKIPILNCNQVDDVNLRLTISEKVSILIKKGMSLLGIKVPNKM